MDINWEEIKSKLFKVGDAAKKIFFVAAGRTQRGAKIASLKVKIVMEENKINKAMTELGKKTFELIEKGSADIASNVQVKDISKIIL